jgi:hypothetical protein
MNPILASGLVSAGQNLLSSALSSLGDKNDQETNFSKVLNSRMFDSAKYMEENGLLTVDDVNRHIEELKGQLLQTKQFINTPHVHEDPAKIDVSRGTQGFILQSPEHKASIPANSDAHNIARTIENLKNWVNSQ